MTSPSVGIGAGATAGISAGQKSGLYVVPVGSKDPPRKGLNKIMFKASTPVMKAACEFLFGSNRIASGIWDKLCIPRVESDMGKVGVKVHMPRGNFYANSEGKARATPFPKYTWYARKGYDKATGIGFFWVAVL